MAEPTFEFEGLEELTAALERVQKACPDFALKQINRAGTQFRKDVIEKTEQLTTTRTGKLISGYRKSVVATSFFGNNFEAQISGGNGKAHHFHLVENGHEGYFYGKPIGFVQGKQMMKKTRDDWNNENKIIPYAEAAIKEAIKKGFISND